MNAIEQIGQEATAKERQRLQSVCRGGIDALWDAVQGDPGLRADLAKGEEACEAYAGALAAAQGWSMERARHYVQNAVGKRHIRIRGRHR